MEKQPLLGKDIREPLFDFLEETYGKIRILEEKTTGRARADVVMITEDKLYGIEIKSDADTYARLKKQVRNYDMYYDRNIVVVGSSHGSHISEHVPKHWGIITVEAEKDGGIDFYILREPIDNTKVRDDRKISILWRIELNNLLKINGLPRYPQKSKFFVQQTLLERVDHDLLWKQLCNELFERDYNIIEKTIKEYRKRKRK